MRWGLIIGLPAVAALVVAAANVGTPRQPSPTAPHHATTAPVPAHTVASVTTASRAASPTVAHHASTVASSTRTEAPAPQPTATQQEVAACLVRNGLSATVALSDAMNPAAHGAGLDGCRANPAYTTPAPTRTLTVPPTSSSASTTPPTSSSASASGSLTLTTGPQTLTSSPPSDSWAQAKQGPGDPWYVKGLQCAEVHLC